jgi:hypothetical protein
MAPIGPLTDLDRYIGRFVDLGEFVFGSPHSCRSTTVLSPIRLPIGTGTGVDRICFTAGVLYSSR